MDATDAILTRRSIRRYQARPIEEEKIGRILRAGLCAPSAHDSQPWEFIVVKDKAALAELSGVIRYWSMLKDADTGIVTVANLGQYSASHPDYFVQDCAAATMNMLMMAHAQGIGGVWLGLYGREDRMQEVRRILGIPSHIRPFSVISLGYPAEAGQPRDAFRMEKVHRERYRRND